MGDFRVRTIKDIHDRRKMYQKVLEDVEAFEMMLKNDMFETGAPWIGAEQELCLVDKDHNPATQALNILDNISDDIYTNELALCNLEINLDPLPLADNCFSNMETSLLSLLNLGEKEANKFDSKLFMTGILPTLKYRHLEFENMTPIRRYKTLSQTLSDIRGSDFEIYLQGVDELIMSLGSVLFEASNTSFQLHLQIAPNDFVNKHNWSQMIAGPVLSACVNSPMLFGNELWAETRVALFKQSLDTRSSQKFLRKKLPRVYFGDKWLEKSAAELWKKDVMRFPLLVTSDDLQNSKELLAKGEIPNLRGIRLHNGTTYTWNRLCYGFSKKKPHLRIECRYIPSGPSALDEISNFAFWIGLMNSEPKHGVDFWKKVDFRIAKDNFIKAARNGLDSVFHWFGKNISARDLILDELLPMAHEGLQNSGVAANDIEKYLSVFEKRVKAETTGADWMVQNFRALTKRFSKTIAEKEIVRQSLIYQSENIPVHEWQNLSSEIHSVPEKEVTVEELMTTDIFSIRENVSVELAKSILEWNNFHHLPVEDRNGDIIGLITDGMIERYEKSGSEEHCFAQDIMLNELHTIQASCPIKEAEKKMKDHNLSGLPVVHGWKLVGMLTRNDLEKVSSEKKKLKPQTKELDF